MTEGITTVSVWATLQDYIELTETRRSEELATLKFLVQGLRQSELKVDLDLARVEMEQMYIDKLQKNIESESKLIADCRHFMAENSRLEAKIAALEKENIELKNKLKP